MNPKDEDQGDGRSRIHSVRIKAIGEATLTVQRERDGSYVATFRRIANSYPERPNTATGDTEERAISAALARAGLNRR